MRKYFISSLIILIMAFTFCIGYFSVPQNIYADSTTDQWLSVTTNDELAWAFKYYCKSRNLAIEGSVLDAVTSFTTFTFNNICSEIGIDVTALQAHLKRSTDSNGGLQFLFDQFGITAYNRIFAEFLQNNNLYVGDTADQENNTVDNGYIFTDDNGHSCYCTVVGNGAPIGAIDSNYVVQKGTYFIKDGKDAYTVFKSSGSTDGSGECTYFTFRVNNNPYTFTIKSSYSSLKYYYSLTGNYNYNGYVYRWNGSEDVTTSGSDTGYPSIIYYSQNGNLYTGVYSNSGKAYSKDRIVYTDDSLQNFYVFLTTNNNTINNNTYNDNKQTVINNEGDVYNYDYDDDDPPVNPPSGGGGDDPSGGDDPIDWPNITFPNILPHLQIPNLKDKFPFSIPWDLIAFYAILNVDPVCPEIETDINLGIVQWHVDLSLEDFEPVAEICRDMYFIAFCVGLIIVTRDLIRG